MFESAAQLLDKIRLAEDSYLELKEVVFAGQRVKGPGRDELADEFAAFANARGGVVVLGVDDKSHDIIGIPTDRLDTLERFVSEILHDSIKPPLNATIEFMELPGTDGRARPILRIELLRSLFVHQSPGGYLHRVGSSKRIMEPEYLARLFQQRSQAGMIRFDEQVVAGSSLEDLDPTLIDRFRTSQTQDDQPTLLRKLAMAREDESGELRPSVAGVLLGSRQPEKWLPNAFIQAVAYRGKSIGAAGSEADYQLDDKDIVGPLDTQIAEACGFVLRNQRVEASKIVGRSDMPQYDTASIFEAVVNAVAHRDYSIHGAKIRMRLFSDRLEISSPGAIANTMTVETLAYRQASRNEALTSLLARCPVPTHLSGLESQRTTLMDRRGEGVSIILERSQRLSGHLPLYELIDASELRLTIFAAATTEIESLG